MAGEVKPVRVRPALRRLVWWVGPVLLLIAAWQIWDAVEARRLAWELTRVREGLPDADPIDPLPKDDAARYYAAAAVATAGRGYLLSRTVQVSPGGPIVDAIAARRSALSGGLAEPAAVTDALQQLQPDPLVVDLLARASAVPFGRFASSADDRYLWSELVSVSRSAGLQTLDLITGGDGDAAAALLFDRVKQLRAFDRRGNALDAGTKALVAGEIAVDLGILVGLTKPSDKPLTDLDDALAGTFTTDELALSIRGQELAFYEETSRPRRWPGPGVLARPLVRHHLVARLQTTADAMQAARLPWPDRIHAMERVPERRSVLPEVPRFIWAWRENEGLRNQTVLLGEGLAAMRCARLVIKVERFRRSSGRLPDVLDELKLPAGDEQRLDPFTGESLHYRRVDEGYVIYSVGRNFKDEGGKLLPDLPSWSSRQPTTDVGVRVSLSRQVGSKQ